MNDLHAYSAENFMAQLPRVIDEDENLHALAYAISRVLAAHLADLPLEEIYTRIDALPEALLDILAYDFKVDWWDPNYSIEEKRRTLKDCWKVHRLLGTKAAVETAVGAIYDGTTVEEWFEYGGEPYHFRLIIDASYEATDPEKHARVLERVNYYKNLRSHLDGVEYVQKSGTTVLHAGAAICTVCITTGATATRPV